MKSIWITDIACKGIQYNALKMLLLKMMIHIRKSLSYEVSLSWNVLKYDILQIAASND